MVGLDSIIVLPILLLAAVVGALVAIATIVFVEANSRGCPICGVEFAGKSDLKAHIKDHKEFFGEVSKGPLGPPSPALKEDEVRPGKAA